MRFVDIDKPRYVRYKDERSGEVVTSEQTIAELLDGSIGLIDEEIVRCKDCKWWKLSDYNTFGIHVCKKFGGVRGEHDFCSRGEGRE